MEIVKKLRVQRIEEVAPELERYLGKELRKLSELVRWQVYEIHLRDGTVHPVSVEVTHE